MLLKCHSDEGGSGSAQPGRHKHMHAHGNPELQVSYLLPDDQLGFVAPAPMQLELAVGSLQCQYDLCSRGCADNSNEYNTSSHNVKASHCCT